MRQLKKLAYAAFGLLALTGCEGGELYDVNAPDWISDKIQEIEDSKKDPQEEEELEGMLEDVYTIGNTDYSSGFLNPYSKEYVIPDGQKWNAVFDLHINPDDNTYYKNVALVIYNDTKYVPNEAEGCKEYGVIRFDSAPAPWNSEWGKYIDRSCISSNLSFDPQGDGQIDANVQKLGGKVTVTVDRTNPETFTVKITNGTVTKTYKHPRKLENLNADESNTNIRCILSPDHSYFNFLQTNIEPIGGLTSAADKNPVSMVLAGVPKNVTTGSKLEDVVKDITAEVTFEEGVKKTVKAEELQFSAIPDLIIPGEKALVAVYNKTFKGENCDAPIMANAKFNVVEQIASIKVTTNPTRQNYTYYTAKATESLTGATLAFDPTGMEVEATLISGNKRTLTAEDKLTFSHIPAMNGKQTVTITTENGKKTNVEVNVIVKKADEEVTNSTPTVGATDNSTGWWGAHSDDFKVESGKTKAISFTNYTSGAGVFNNFVVILRNAAKNKEYSVVRADNYGWDANTDNNPDGKEYEACIHNSTHGNSASWLTDMNGAKVTIFVTNNGNGTADVLAVMKGNKTVYTQYYLGINDVNANDLYFALTVDKCHLVFNK